MKTALDCMPCFVRQTLEAVRANTSDARIHEQIVREVLALVAQLDLNDPPPLVAQRIHRRIRELTGIEDPYRAAKERFNTMALEILPTLRARVQAAPDPLEMAARLAIAGNVIDLGIHGDLTPQEARLAVDRALEETFVGDMPDFKRAVAEAERILFLADNAGEIVLDRLLLEQLPPENLTVAVRGGAVLNDATRVDAEAAGIPEQAHLIDNGSDAPGTVLSDCSAEFRDYYNRADLIVAKGQGNFETLNDEPANIFFLFKVKCPVIADHIGLPVGTHVLSRSRSNYITVDFDQLVQTNLTLESKER